MFVLLFVLRPNLSKEKRYAVSASSRTVLTRFYPVDESNNGASTEGGRSIRVIMRCLFVNTHVTKNNEKRRAYAGSLES